MKTLARNGHIKIIDLCSRVGDGDYACVAKLIATVRNFLKDV
jgi:hypothetical protein